MKQYIDLLKKILYATMSSGEYRIALQTLQTLIKNKPEKKMPSLHDLDNEELASLIENYKLSH